MSLDKEDFKTKVESVSQNSKNSYENVSNQAKKAISQTKNSVETQIGNKVNEVKGGIKSLSDKATNLQDKFQNASTEGLVTDGIESLKGSVNDAINGAVSNLLGKFGVKVNVEWIEDSDGYGNTILVPSEKSLEVDTNSTIAGILTLITGLGINSGFVQNVVSSASPAGLKSALSNLEGKVGSFASVDAVKDLAKKATDDVITDIKNKTTFPDQASETSFDNDFAVSFTNAKEDVNNNITEGITVRDLDKTLGDVTGKNGKDVLNDVLQVKETKETLTSRANNYAKQTDNVISKNSEIGLLQGYAESITNIGKDTIKNLNPNLSDEEITEIVGLSQGTDGQKNEAVSKIAKGTQTSVSQIRSSVFNLNTTIAGQTVIDKSKIVLNDPFDVGIDETEDNASFSYISSFEELEAELRSSTREITEIVVHWTDTFTDRDIGAEEINQAEIDLGSSGIGYHYVIRRDGSLQRGVPVKEQGRHADINGHNEYSIGVVFVGGYNCSSGTENPEIFQSSSSLTRAQMTTFEQFCRAFYMAYPGGFVLGHNDIDLTEPDPGFDVKDYVSDIFGKENFLGKSINFADRGPLSPKEIVSGEIS